MNESVQTVLNRILYQFKSGDIPKAIAVAMFPIADIPAANWSLLNRTLMCMAGTADARGFRQWQKISRYVKKGAKAFYILAPCIYKKEDEQGQEKQVLTGFRSLPVFCYEDTDGEALDYKQIELPAFPLIERAEEWGVPVKAIPGNKRCFGFYSLQKKEIALATPAEKTFFHELSHAAHDRVKKGLNPGQDPLQEIVAELSAQALCRIAGRQADNTLGNSYEYIDGYAKKISLTPAPHNK